MSSVPVSSDESGTKQPHQAIRCCSWRAKAAPGSQHHTLVHHQLQQRSSMHDSWRSLVTAASSFSSFSFCSPDPVFCLLLHLHLNPCFYLISLLSPVLAVLIPKQTNKQNTSKSGRFSPTWALHHLSIWCGTETFPCVFLLSVLWSLPIETCLPSWELMLRAGN